MPRPRRVSVAWIATVATCAALSPPALHAALAAAAGTLFEAAPFVLAAPLLRAERLRALAFASGCGCRGGPLPGALALPALALCGLTFGWPLALGRALAAFALSRVVSRWTRAALTTHAAPTDIGDLHLLASLVPATFAVALVRESVLPRLGTVVLPDGSPHGAATRIAWEAGGAVTGLVLARAMPCATAGIAVAAGLAGLGSSLRASAALHVAAPAAGLVLLAASGVLPDRPRRLPVRPHPRDSRAGPAGRTPAAQPGGSPGRRAARARCMALAALAALLGYVALAAPPGFVSPRLRPVVALGAVVALVRIVGIASAWRRRDDANGRALETAGRDGRSAFVVLATMFAALVSGAPSPVGIADGTVLERAYPGEALAFVGTARRAGATTLLERATISCCRIDATVSSVALDRVLTIPDGAWIEARGALVRAADGRLRLRPAAIRGLPPPRDPFAYR